MSSKKMTIAWWNVQNLFGLSESDMASAFGFTAKKGWTASVYNKKITNIATAIKCFCSDGVPALIGLCEVENSAVLHDLIDAIGYEHYKVYCHDSTDMDGIDTAFIYDSSTIETTNKPKGYDIYTRHHTHDILEANFRSLYNGEEFTVLANHWPSRRSGRFSSEPFRIAVADFCSRIVASHLKLDESSFNEIEDKGELSIKIEEKASSHVILLGDFNDEPFDRSIREYLKAVPVLPLVCKKIATKRNLSYKYYQKVQPFLYNPTWKLLDNTKPGTYFFSTLVTNWAFLDQVVLSKGLLGKGKLQYVHDSLRVIAHKNITSRSGKTVPFSFKDGKVKGTSDHLPLIFEINLSL